MSNHECQRCGESKAADEMVVRGGKPSRTCKACFAASFKGGSQAKATTPRKPKAAPAPEPVKINGSLEVAAGFGFRASHEDGAIHVEQDREDGGTVYTHTLTLAPHEARQLVEFIKARLTT